MPKELTVIAAPGQVVTVRGGTTADKVKSATVTSTKVRAVVTMAGAYVEPVPPPVDPKPEISGIVVTPNATGAQIAWHVSEKAKGEVRYGPTAALGFVTPRQDDLTYQDHIQQITGVTYKTVYYQIWAEDSARQEGLSPIAHFDTTTVVTPIPPDPGTPTLPPGTPVFNGTGGNDEANLTSFLNANAAKTCAIDGLVKLGDTVIPKQGLTGRIVVLPTGKLKQQNPGKQVIRLYGPTGLVIDAWKAEGTGFKWEGIEDPLQDEHGIAIYGGGDVIINDPEIWNTRGDGIYSGSGWMYPQGQALQRVGINRPKLHHNSRNNITHNCGSMAVSQFSLAMAGLIAIDLEPNYPEDAATIAGTYVDGRIDSFGQFSGISGFTGYAFGACSRPGIKQKSIDMRRIAADKFSFVIQGVNSLVMYDLSSDIPVADPKYAVYYAQYVTKDIQRLKNIAAMEYANCW